MFAKAPTQATAGLTNKLTPHRSPLTAQRFGAGALEQVRMLQRSIGNQATLRLLTNQLAPTVERSQPGLTGAVTDGIGIEPSEQFLTDKNGDAGAPAPDAGAPAADAGAPPAHTGAPAADAGAPAAVTAVAFGTINSATTPAGMISRIPPRIDQPISVAVTGAGNVDISVDGASGANGTATLDGAATKTVAASGTVNLRGATQTTAGNAGNLRLVAKVGGTTMGTSNAFTICAIPTTVTISPGGLITGTERGIKATTSNDSDSGQVSDLDQVQMSEKVQYVNGAGCFAGITSGNNSGFLPANNSPHGVDSHGTPVSLITGAGSIDSRQVFVFNDARSGANNVSVKNSGFNIHREVTATVTDAGTNLSITTSKAGMATTVAGSAAQAGSGSVTATQAV
jgi:hypothetical protein